MNGGYALIDLSKYDLTYDVDEASALENANELSKEEFDELILKFKNAKNNGKPIVVKTEGLYDESSLGGTFFIGNCYITSALVAFAYNDINDNALRYIAIFKHDNKYYIASVPRLWMY